MTVQFIANCNIMGVNYLSGQTAAFDPALEAQLISSSIATAVTITDGRIPCPQYTWTTKPGASNVPIGFQIFITDVGGWNGSTYSGSYWFTDGVVWRPVGDALLLHTLAAPIAINNANVLQVDYAQIVVPAGMLRNGSRIEVDLHAAATATATFRCQFGTSAVWGSSVGMAGGVGFPNGVGAATGNLFLSRDSNTQVRYQISSLGTPASSLFTYPLAQPRDLSAGTMDGNDMILGLSFQSTGVTTLYTCNARVVI